MEPGRPTFRVFVTTVVKRSMTEWQEGEGLFALSAYITVLLLPLLVTGTVRQLLGDTVNLVLALGATSWLVVLFFMVTPYRIWADEYNRAAEYREKMRPTIRALYADDDPACRKQVLLAHIGGRQKGFSLRAKIENQSNVVARGCAGFLLKVGYRKDGNDGFSEIHIFEPNKLPWALEENEYRAVDIHPRVPKFLGICGTREHENFFSYRPEVESFIVSRRFREHGEYRFSLGITSVDSPTCLLRVVISWNGTWDEVKAWAVEESLASKAFGETHAS